VTQQPMAPPGPPQAQGYAVPAGQLPGSAGAGQLAGPAGQLPASAGQVLPGQLLGATTSRPSPFRAFLSSAFEGTPGRMRLIGTVAALAAAIFGIIGANNLWSASGALDRANHTTAQVVRVQGIYADLLRADADATNAFLVGGLENAAQRADYDAALAGVTRAIAEAAKAQPADGTVLGALNTQVQTYAATVEQARVYNRQGLPIGAQYLNNASLGLRSSALPIVAATTQANERRANDEFAASRNGLGLAITGALSLIVLVLAMVWLARRTHRYLNAPLTIATVLVLLALLIGALTISSVASQIKNVRNAAYQSTLSLATARSAAFDAKSNESLTLVARAGNASEPKWTQPSDAVLTNLDRVRASSGLSPGEAATLTGQWQAYGRAHQAIRQLDDAGTWDKAVAAATSTEAGSANALFTTFAASSATSLAKASQTTQTQVTAPRTRTTLAGWVLLVVSLGAALLSVRGISQRLEEYR